MVALNFLLLFVTFILPLIGSYLTKLIPKRRFLNGFATDTVKKERNMILPAKNTVNGINHLVVDHIHSLKERERLMRF